MRAINNVINKLFPDYSAVKGSSTQDAFRRGQQAVPEGRDIQKAQEIFGAKSDPALLPDAPPEVGVEPAAQPEVVVEPEGRVEPEAPAIEQPPAEPDPELLGEHISGPTVEELTAPNAVPPETRTRARNINLDYIDVENLDDVGRMLDVTADKLQLGTEPARTFEQVEASVASEGAVNILKDVLTENPKGAWTDRQLLAARQVFQTAARDQKALAEKIASGDNVVPEDLAKFDILSDQTTMLMNILMGKRREAARALNSQKISVQALNMDAATALRKFASDPNVANRAAAIATLAKNGASDKEILAESAKMSRFKAATTVAMEVRSAAMLTSPRTHFTNLISNAIYGAHETLLIRPVAGAVGAARTAVGMGPPDRAYIGQSYAEVMGTIHGVYDGLLQMKATYQEGVKNDTEFSSFFGEQSKTEMMSEDMPTPPGFLRRQLRKASFGLLTAADDLFKMMHYRKTLYGEIYKRAQDEGVSKEAWPQFLEDNFDDISFEAHEAALKAAHEQTFTDSNHDTVIGEMARGMTSFAAKHPLMRIPFPYVTTPMSLVDKVIKLSPPGAAGNLVMTLKHGKGVDYDTAVSKLIVGSAYTYLGYSLAVNSSITGNGPRREDDPTGALRRQLEATGWQPDSLRVGDVYISLKRLQPFSSILLGPARAYEASLYSKTEEDALDLFINSAMQTAVLFSEATLLRSMYETLSLVFSDTTSPQRYAANLANSFIPNVVKDVAKAARGDEQAITPRYTDGIDLWLTGVQHAIPGMPARQIARYWDGTPKISGGDWGTTASNIVLPFMSSWAYESGGRAGDPATEALLKSRVSVAPVRPDVPIGVAGATMNLLELPRGYELYEMYIEEVGKQRRRYVENLVNSSAFQDIPIEERGVNSEAALQLTKAVRDGKKLGTLLFLDKVAEMDLEAYGGEETQKMLTGADAMALREKLEEGLNLSDEEKQRMVDYGMRGVQTKDPLEIPKGSKTGGDVKRYREDFDDIYVPNIN